MNDNYTIAEEFTLPSKGLIYNKPVNPVVTLRSMTTEEEMLRLTHSERPYKLLSSIIDSCIVGEKPGISAYDMCLGDYQFLLHKLRVVTYGSNYSAESICPYCGAPNKMDVDLEKIEVFEYKENLEKYFEFTLPRTKKCIRIKMQTPRDIDEIQLKIKDVKKRHPEMESDPTILFTVQSLIDKVDGQVVDPVKLDNIVRKLPMADTNYILKCAEKLNLSIGLDTALVFDCKGCGVDYITPFRITPEFFGPGIDI